MILPKEYQVVDRHMKFFCYEKHHQITDCRVDPIDTFLILIQPTGQWIWWLDLGTTWTFT